jgi:hypothetical protein
MEPFQGLAVWNNHQSKHLQALRQNTQLKDVEYESDRGIVFVEPRKHPSCEYVLRNMRYFLPTWKIFVVHGTSNEEFLKEICATISGTEFISCKAANLPNASYNTMFTSPDFWALLPRYVLIAQTDTLLLKPAQKMLETFISKQYAFVGAPWNYLCNKCKKPITEGCGHMIDQSVVASMAPEMVGNGGLSFRDTFKMKELSSSYCMEAKPCPDTINAWPAHSSRTVIKGTSNEDVFFCKVLTQEKNPMPTRLEALEFAVEQVAPFAWSDSPALGAHKPWAYLPLPLVETLLGQVKYT